jgi:hypothetical protein
MIFNLGLGAEKPFNSSNFNVVADFQNILTRKVTDNYFEIDKVARSNDLENHFEYLIYLDQTLSNLNESTAFNYEKVKSMILFREQLLAMFYTKIQVVFYPDLKEPEKVHLSAFYSIVDSAGENATSELELDNLLPENSSIQNVYLLSVDALNLKITQSVFSTISNQIVIPDNFIGPTNATKDKDNQRVANFMLRVLTSNFNKLETQSDSVDINSTLNLIKRDFKILINVLNKIDLLLIQKGKIR